MLVSIRTLGIKITNLRSAVGPLYLDRHSEMVHVFRKSRFE